MASCSSPGRANPLMPAEASGCTKCALSCGRQNVVWGRGHPSAPIMLLGEAPGRWEDIEGQPFVGQSGKLLERLAREAGLNASDLYITNTVKCRPPDNRDPLPREVEACQEWLVTEITTVDPAVILTVGSVASRCAFAHEKRVPAGEARCVSLFGLSPRVVLAAYHPAAALRNPKLQGAILRDLRRAKRYANEFQSTMSRLPASEAAHRDGYQQEGAGPPT